MATLGCGSSKPTQIDAARKACGASDTLRVRRVWNVQPGRTALVSFDAEHDPTATVIHTDRGWVPDEDEPCDLSL